MSRSGMDTKKALKRAVELGCTVEQGKGGERKVRHPSRPDKTYTVSNHRKDCPRVLTTLIRQLEQEAD